jgi:hypothetical protein
LWRFLSYLKDDVQCFIDILCQSDEVLKSL